MSNLQNEMIMEGLADEFYDDIDYACEWLAGLGLEIDGLCEDRLCTLFVTESMSAMGGY